MVLRKEITLQIKDLLKENPQGLSITDIVKVVAINRNTAGRYLENLLISGQVEMRRLGMAKIYVLSQRVPALGSTVNIFRTGHAAGQQPANHLCKRTVS